MKKIAPLLLFMVATIFCKAADTDSIMKLNLPDSVKAVQLMAELKIESVSGKKTSLAGIKTDLVSLYLETEKNDREVKFSFPAKAKIVALGMGVEIDDDELELEYNWALNENYKLLLSIASDSADNFTLYSGYLWLPEETKWKLIGTCRIEERWWPMKEPAFYYSSGKKNGIRASAAQVWIQRNTGSWKNMMTEGIAPPVINLYAHIDSLAQFEHEKKIIDDAIASGKTDARLFKDGVYYMMMKEGNDVPVLVSDTVVAYYKGYLFDDNTVFDQTKDKPATFPLNRLIKGWQIGVPLCKVGGKIKLVIPSGLAYSIRTRAAKIPPNSILVFEIEVLETKPAMPK